ncbi:MAG: TolC family protein [Rikenellaceae bacterium]
MKKLINISLVLLCTLSLSSCGLYSKFETPELDEKAQELYNYLEANQDTTTIASMPWKSFFTDPALQELISDALANNTDMNLAKLSVDQAEIALKTARLAYVPSFNLNSSLGYSSSSDYSYAASVSASWEIDFFGKIRNAKKVQQAAVEQSKVYKEAVQTQLIATMANSYYSLLVLDEQLKISIKTKENWLTNLEVMRALMKAGRLDESSVLQSEASAVALNSQIATLEQQIIEMENTISLLLAKPLGKIKRGELSNVTFSDNLAVGVPLQLLSNRADVKVAEYNLSQAFYATALAKSSLYPNITLSGSAGYSGGGVTLSSPGDMIYSAVLSLVQPLFNSGSLRAQVKISKSQQEGAMLSFKQTVLDAGSEVNTALNQLQTAKKLVSYDKEQIALLSKAVTSTELLMKHGSVTYLDVLTKQLSLLQAELSLTSDIYSEIQGSVNMYRALGGGAR